MHDKLAHLGDIANVTDEKDSNAVKAEKFINSIKALNKKMDIGENFPELRSRDISDLADTAYSEANPLYPVPVIFTKADFIRMYKKLMSV